MFIISIDVISPEVISLLKKIMEQTKPLTERHVFEGSNISEKRGKKYFYCFQHVIEVELKRITNHFCNRNHVSISSHREIVNKEILSEVVNFSLCMSQYQASNQTLENEYVRPQVNGLLPKILKNSKYFAKLELEEQRPYYLQFHCDHADIDVSGIFDHTVRLENSDARFWITEDKRLNLKLTTKEVNQVVSQIMFEVDVLSRVDFVPIAYCGILHNGITWKFIWRIVKCGEIKWHHVESPSCVNSDGSINIEGCEIVSVLLQHTITTMDDNIEEFLNPKRNNRIFLTTQVEDKAEDEDEDDDESNNKDDSQDDKDDSPQDVNQVRQITATMGNMSVIDSSEKSKKTKQQIEYYNYCDKENFILPLTQKYINQQPLSRFKSF